MTEQILTMACGITGAAEEDALMKALCTAADVNWTNRLKNGMTAEDCAEAFCCAVAFTAAADYTLGMEADGISGFSAGTVSIQRNKGNDCTELAQALRQTAQRLMMPYTEVADFCFKGVRA